MLKAQKADRDLSEMREPFISSQKASVSGSYCNTSVQTERDQLFQKQAFPAALQKTDGKSVSSRVSPQKTMEAEGRNYPTSQVPGPKEQRPNSKTISAKVHCVGSPSPNKILYEATSMERFLDLVDKYWHGYKSLHCNEKFLSQAGPLLSAMQKSTLTDQQKDSIEVHQELDNLLLEKKALKNTLSEQDQKYSIRINNLMSEMSSTKKEKEALKKHLDQLLEENTNLKSHLSHVDQNVKTPNTLNSLQSKFIELQNLNQQISSENNHLKQRLQQYSKIQELAEMLQESHRTLVSTNEHLLQELTETRKRHKAEVEQLHWSYNQLKKTMGRISPSSLDNSRC
uniref:Centrosomal protein 72 n=1 Tax=Sphenodon punctatus TaxID=8508 RepID=A0A8D0G821_SPHPU